MKSIILTFVAFFSATIVQSLDPYYNVQSNPFRLILKSANETLNGYALGAYHQGAAIEGLALTSQYVTDPATSYTTFRHNVSSSMDQLANANDTTGALVYLLPVGNFNVPSGMTFVENKGSNMADMIFFPGDDTLDTQDTVAFDEDGGLYIPINQDDTVSPPNYYNPALKLKNWFICVTRFSYTSTALVWKFGVTGSPQNPTCESVEVERVWI